MDQDTPTSDWRKMMVKARKALAKSLNDFGCSATLNLVIGLSNKDLMANELLCLYPKVASMEEFLSRIPVLRMADMKGSENGKRNSMRNLKR